MRLCNTQTVLTPGPFLTPQRAAPNAAVQYSPHITNIGEFAWTRPHPCVYVFTVLYRPSMSLGTAVRLPLQVV